MAWETEAVAAMWLCDIGGAAGGVVAADFAGVSGVDVVDGIKADGCAAVSSIDVVCEVVFDDVPSTAVR